MARHIDHSASPSASTATISAFSGAMKPSFGDPEWTTLRAMP